MEIRQRTRSWGPLPSLSEDMLNGNLSARVHNHSFMKLKTSVQNLLLHAVEPFFSEGSQKNSGIYHGLSTSSFDTIIDIPISQEESEAIGGLPNITQLVSCQAGISIRHSDLQELPALTLGSLYACQTPGIVEAQRVNAPRQHCACRRLEGLCPQGYICLGAIRLGLNF